MYLAAISSTIKLVFSYESLRIWPPIPSPIMAAMHGAVTGIKISTAQCRPGAIIIIVFQN